jgi:hypothetical protein
LVQLPGQHISDNGKKFVVFPVFRFPCAFLCVVSRCALVVMFAQWNSFEIIAGHSIAATMVGIAWRGTVANNAWQLLDAAHML